MYAQRFQTLAEQVAHEIKSRIIKGHWEGKMPGRQKLAAELGVNHKTCDSALRLLEKEGLLMSQGSGLGRVIVKSPVNDSAPASIRVRVLLYEKSDLRSDYLVELLHRLREMGHDANFSDKTMKDLGMSVNRIISHVNNTKADAWIVLAGPQNILQWFSEQSFPSFALFGRMMNTQIASIIPDKQTAIDTLVSRLVGYGHQRIVMVTREDRRKPSPGASEKKFMSSLEANGIATSSYNLPDWGDSPEEMVKMLESLFKYTPPTAMILSEAPLFFATMQWLSRIGLSAPDHVSLACMDPNPIFEWCRPKVTHISWGTTPLVNRMVNWVNNVSIGKTDRRKMHINASLIDGSTIGSASKKSAND